MTTSIDKIHDELMDLRRDISYIKSIISEDFELSEHAKSELEHSRSTPNSEYIEI